MNKRTGVLQLNKMDHKSTATQKNKHIYI